MSVREFANQLRLAVEEIKQRGVPAIQVDNLIAYLTSVEQSSDPNPSPAELERYKAELDQYTEATRHANAQRIEMFKSVIMAGQNTIRSMTVINGGAAVAMLAFLGHLAEISSSSIPAFANSLLPFVLGTLFAGLVSGSTYLSQWFYGGQTKGRERIGFGFNILAIVLGLLSFGAFLCGSVRAYDTFRTMPPLAHSATDVAPTLPRAPLGTTPPATPPLPSKS